LTCAESATPVMFVVTCWMPLEASAKPLPASPARTASIVAFRASRFVRDLVAPAAA
jgi:hypothetical protein